MNVVIPSAKIVPEDLQSLGKLPAVIYPVGQGIVFDYLFKQYQSRAKSVKIICYEMADAVEQGLIPYRTEKVQLIRLPKLGSLADTIYAGLKMSHSPLIINFADTIVLDELPENCPDGFFYSEDYVSDTWTFFEDEDGMLTSVWDKQKGLDEKARKKLFVGVFWMSDEADFKRCLEQAFKESVQGLSTFYHALKLYSKTHRMQPVQAEDWFDIGHAEKYYDSKLEVQAREFNHISIDKNRGILRKSSDDREKFIGEILWYLRLPADIEYVRPRVFSYSVNYDCPYVAMEYYAYHTVHELFLYGDLNYYQWIDVFGRIRFIYNDFKRYSVKDDGIRAALEDVYLNKTLDRLGKLKNDRRFSSFFNMPVYVNGTRYLTLDDVCNRIKTVIPEQLYDADTFHIIHGDLCFSNIMVDSNFSFIKVIDPRGQFGSYDIYGDQRYELAKLFHSVDGKYDYIIKDLFRIAVDENNAKIDFEILERPRNIDLYELFLQVFQKEIGGERKKIELIEALLFLSMIPLHGENVNHQYAMLATGLQILDRVTDIRYKREER